MDKQSPAEKVLSVMPQSKAIRLSEITALSGFSEDRVLRILVAEEWAGTVQRVQADERTEAFWMRI
jgi:predicted transcriptional regulator